MHDLTVLRKFCLAAKLFEGSVYFQPCIFSDLLLFAFFFVLFSFLFFQFAFVIVTRVSALPPHFLGYL